MFEISHRQTQSARSQSASPARLHRARPQPALSPLLAHQKAIGNQAVQQRLLSRALQAKLIVNEPGDEYEREADRVAEQVMSMPEPAAQKQVHRACLECEVVQRQPDEEEEEKVQAKPIAEQITSLVQRQAGPEEEEEEAVQRKGPSGETKQVSRGLEAQIRSMRGGGQPLSPQARGFFEPRFGHDFGHVRVHADEQAVETARALNAKAYTMGNDIVVGENNQSSKREARDKLLAHELTHVVQQTSRNSGQVALIPIQRQQKGEQVPESSQIKAKEAGDLLDIKEVIKFFKPGGTAIVTDIGAEKSYMAKAISVDTHADIYPISAADTQILKDIYNFKGDFVAWCEQTPHKLWTRRAIIITIDADPIKGRKIAASQHGCPHGFGKSGIKNFEKGMTLKNHHEDNKYPGHFCIHFLHSRKHRPGEEDAVHQQMVYKAAGIEPAKSKKKK